MVPLMKQSPTVASRTHIFGVPSNMGTVVKVPLLRADALTSKEWQELSEKEDWYASQRKIQELSSDMAEDSNSTNPFNQSPKPMTIERLSSCLECLGAARRELTLLMKDPPLLCSMPPLDTGSMDIWENPQCFSTTLMGTALSGAYLNYSISSIATIEECLLKAASLNGYPRGSTSPLTFTPETGMTGAPESFNTQLSSGDLLQYSTGNDWEGPQWSTDEMELEMDWINHLTSNASSTEEKPFKKT